MSSPDSSIIQFVLNGALVCLTDPDPQMTVLQYCREQALLTGTHEGCAEGDCGACTVVVAELNAHNELRYQHVNACILLLPMLDGKALLTVESLKQGDELHPVQQAMIEHHASQCGFCTPGFVMALFALFQSKKPLDTSSVTACLSGNLCRCTGYKPIIDAALHMAEYDVPAEFIALQEHLKKQLSAIRNVSGKLIQQNDLLAYIPKTVDELCRLKAEHHSLVIVAGNTDVGLWLNKQLKDIPGMVLIKQLDELKQITFYQGELSIGAAVSIYDAFQTLVKCFPGLSDLARRFASQSICHAATLVGNLANASPIGDAAPILMALGARVRLRHLDGYRDVALDDFYLGYQQKDLSAHEFIESVIIPVRANDDKHIACYKVSKRFDQDIAAITMALVVGIDENDKVSSCRIVCGGMAATTQRAKKTEAVLLDNVWDLQRIYLAQKFLRDDFSPLDDLRATADYRMSVAKNLLTRFYVTTTQTDADVSVFEGVSSS